jgi:hypothetical protein
VLKKTMVLSAVAAATLASAAPIQAAPAPARSLVGDDWQVCLLRAGCCWDSNAMAWVCPDPRYYMLCDAPVGGGNP